MSSKGKKRKRNSERSLLEASAGTDDEEGVDMEDAVTRDNSKGKAVTTNGKASSIIGQFIEYCELSQYNMLDVKTVKAFLTFKAHSHMFKFKQRDGSVKKKRGSKVKDVKQYLETLNYGTSSLTDMDEAAIRVSFTQQQWNRWGHKLAELRKLKTVLTVNARALNLHVSGVVGQKKSEGFVQVLFVFVTCTCHLTSAASFREAEM